MNQLRLNEILENVYVFLGPTNVGIVAIPQNVEHPQNDENNSFTLYLIDTGETPEYAQKIYAECERVFKNFSIKAILATHGHADHIGGNAWFVEKTGCQVWATQEEKTIIENPKIPGSMICGGFPLPEFTTSYHRAERTFVSKIICGGQKDVLENGFEVEYTPLPGHYMEMVGITVKTPNGQSAFFAGDGIFGRGMLARYWMPFLYDVKEFKASLERIEKVNATKYVPSHGDVCEEIAELVEFNLLSTISNEKALEQILQTPHTWEQILKEFADLNNIPLRLSQYYLVGCTIRSYLSYLYSEGRIKWVFKDNFMYWESASPEALRP